MSTERVVLVGIIWAVLLLALLILREFLRAIRTESRRRVLPVLDRLVLLMIVAFAVAAGLRLVGLISPPANASPGTSASTDVALASPSATVVQTVAPTLVPTLAPTQTLPPTQQPTPTATPTIPPTPTTPPTVTPTSPPTPTTPATVTPTLPPTPAPTPTVAPTVPPTPALTVPPTVAPTLPPTPAPTLPPTPTPGDQSQGNVTVPASFHAYVVRDGAVRSFHQVQASRGFSARSTAPQSYGFATFSNPDGTIELVQILSGPYAGTFVSPEDPGVHYSGS